VCQSQPTARFT
jgi:hypothetical protein